MALTLYTYESHLTSAHKAAIVAKYNNIPVTIEDKSKAPKEVLQHPLASVKNYDTQWPVLVTEEGPLFESNAIARYFAKKGSNNLLGEDSYEQALIDQWVDTSGSDIFLPAITLVYSTMGLVTVPPEGTKVAEKELANYLQALNNHLLARTFIVGNRVSLADIVVSMTLLDLFRWVFDEKTLTKYSNVTRWFLTCVNQPTFKEVIGEVRFHAGLFIQRKVEKAGSAALKERRIVPKKTSQNTQVQPQEGQQTVAPLPPLTHATPLRKLTDKDLELIYPSTKRTPTPTKEKMHENRNSPTIARNLHQPK